MVQIFNIFYLADIIFSAIYFFAAAHILKSLPKSENTKKRQPFFDFLKGVAIICIIAIHSTDVVESIGSTTIKELLWSSIPLFLIASGFLLEIRYHGKIMWKEYLKKVFFRVVLIYLLFVIVIGILKGGSSITGLMLDAAFGRTNGNYYFIPIIIQLYMLYPLLSKYSNKLSPYIGLFIMFLFTYASRLYDYYAQSDGWNSDPYSLIFSGRFLLFFVFGIYLGKKQLSKISIKQILLMAFIQATGMLFFYLYFRSLYSTFMMPITLFFMALLLYRAATGQALYYISDVLISLGKNSLVIYLIHTRFIYDILYKIDFFPGVTADYLVIVISAAFLSYVFAIIFNKLYQRAIGSISLLFARHEKDIQD